MDFTCYFERIKIDSLFYYNTITTSNLTAINFRVKSIGTNENYPVAIGLKSFILLRFLITSGEIVVYTVNQFFSVITDLLNKT
jgi:hypothetical protein